MTVLLNSAFLCINLWDFYLDLRSQGHEQKNTSTLILSQISESVWMEFGWLLRHVGLMTLILYFVFSDQKTFACLRTYTAQFLANLVWRIRGFPTRMVYVYYISCLRCTILVGNPWDRHSQTLQFDTSLNSFDFHNIQLSEEGQRNKT